ncbi:uncharacterized protein ELE39_003543 [Cryptosporidium sp. chipmunk genotype I]|uniref:uncharacterized protein n=1 Tax=Cryptosporidium sp. chipmunk genotype I TaxID=1280935 RepID=UPI003519DB82|nr:hypothetical protein ELE39_003543 [Cryptosporidium sp. chipmunk genotype I]
MRINLSLFFLWFIVTFTQIFFQISECIQINTFNLSSNGTISHEQKLKEIKEHLIKNITNNSTELNEEASLKFFNFNFSKSYFIGTGRYYRRAY